MGNDGHNKQRDLSYTQNRELSWLRFDERVLSESLDDTVPLFERLKFIAIFESNMHEFLMVRMGGLSSLATLKRQPRDNKSGMTPSEQVAAVFSALPGLFSKAASSLDAIESLLRAKGIVDGGDTWYEFDMVPGEHEIRACGPDVTGKLCVIGSDLKEHEIAALFHV